MSKLTSTTSPDLIEGGVITRDSISDTYTTVYHVTGVGDAKESIDEQNIREEGLDRRSFAGGTSSPWYGNQSVNRACELRTEALIRGSSYPVQKWHKFTLSDLKFSTNGNFPEVTFNWDPEVDSSVIIRCSLYARLKNGFNLANDRLKEYDMWDFGLKVIPPGKDESIVPDRLAFNPYNGGIWPYARFFRNPAFSRFATSGGAGDAGEWNQNKFDKRGGMSQSVMLMAMAQSKHPAATGSHSGADCSQSYWFNSKGTAKVQLLARHRLLADSTTPPNDIYVEGLNFSVTKYRC